MLIINADDWGGWESATDAALACFKKGRITSVSAMVFMADSARAAVLAKETGIDVGLHLNLNSPFTGTSCPEIVRHKHLQVGRWLRLNKYAQLVYNPMLDHAFSSIYHAQIGEFVRLYGRPPSHIDGHQHMHLCANMLCNRIIPKGEKIRRNFSFESGEKSHLNRAYRRWVDRRLDRYYRMTDYFFSLAQCLQHNRLSRALDLAKTAKVELMAHPEKTEESEWLSSDNCGVLIKPLELSSYSNI